MRKCSVESVRQRRLGSPAWALGPKIKASTTQAANRRIEASYLRSDRSADARSRVFASRPSPRGGRASRGPENSTIFATFWIRARHSRWTLPTGSRAVVFASKYIWLDIYSAENCRYRGPSFEGAALVNAEKCVGRVTDPFFVDGIASP